MPDHKIQTGKENLLDESWKRRSREKRGSEGDERRHPVPVPALPLSGKAPRI